MTTIISLERPDTLDGVKYIDELESHLAPIYPQENRFGHSIDKLIQQGMAFFILRQDGIPVWCGGVHFFDLEYSELKRMFVRSQFRGLGLGKLMIEYLENYAREHNIPWLRLYTGIHQKEAVKLYQRMGYQSCPPSGELSAIPFYVYLQKRIANGIAIASCNTIYYFE